MRHVANVKSASSILVIRSLKCDLCDFVASSKEQLGGHRSGHSRRLEPKFHKGSVAARLNSVSETEFTAAVADATSFLDLARLLNLPGAGGNLYSLVRNRCKKLGISTEHFLGQRSGTLRKIVDLNVDCNLQAKKRLLIELHGNVCWSCGLSHWLGESIPLQLDHIDGNRENNDNTNLRLLCGTCHTLTPTWGNKRRK